MSSTSSQTSPGGLDLFSMIWSPYQTFQQAIMPYKSTTNSITDLDDCYLMYIYQYLNFDDLIRCRQVSRRFLESIDKYFRLQKKLVYNCQTNCVSLYNGHYQINLDAFKFIVKRMPNLQILRFERCSMMRSALANCHYNLFNDIAEHLNELKELHIGRAFFINADTLEQLARALPKLTHLTISIYNENLLRIIVDQFRQLSFLNLIESVIYDYSEILRNLPSTIKTLILPIIHINDQYKILKNLFNGHGINLERFEVQITVNNIVQDKQYFDLIGQMMNNLVWFQCELNCNDAVNSHLITTQQSKSKKSIENINDDDDANLNLNNNNFNKELNNNNNNNIEIKKFKDNLEFISGLHRLAHLRVLILKENDYFETNDSQHFSLFDDNSLLKIFQHCTGLIMLSISATLCCNKINYARYNMNRKHDDQTINRILNEYFSNEYHLDHLDASVETNVSSHNCGTNKLCGNKEMNKISDVEYTAHAVTDISLKTLSHYLSKLRILQLRGVCMGQSTLESISMLQYLQFLRLDSIQFIDDENSDIRIKESFNALMLSLTGNPDDDEYSKKTKTHIHLTNISLL